MNLSTLQTELVACALCQADGRNPDEDLPTDQWESDPDGAAGSTPRAVTRKAWQFYETEARKLVLAAETMAKFSQALGLFRDIALVTDAAGHA